MKLAVFTSKYPAQIATFFERDMLALLAAGVDLEIFAIYPLDGSLWNYSLAEQADDQRLRARVHHLDAATALRGAGVTVMQHPTVCAEQMRQVLPAAARFGPEALAKTAYVLPKAWTWAVNRANDFDHVLAYWGNYAGTCAWAFHQLAGRAIPFSIWLHAGTDLYRNAVYLRPKLLYADNILTCCEFNVRYIAQQFTDIHPRIRNRVHVVHHGLDLAAYPFLPDGRVPRRIVAVGRLSAYKGFEYLLRAVALLVQAGEDVTLDLVGGGELRGALAQEAAALGIASRVLFRGWVAHPEARSAMRDATLLVHPSDGLGDGLPNVIREAMALGTPVVASNVAGIPDALADGCGRLVPPKDPVALATAIRELLADADGRRVMAHLARTRVERSYDLWTNGRHLAQLLEHSRRAPLPRSAAPTREVQPV